MLLTNSSELHNQTAVGVYYNVVTLEYIVMSNSCQPPPPFDLSDILFILLQNHTHIRNMVYNIDIQ